MLRIRKGFQGQRLAVYPFYVIKDRLGLSLCVHSMGFFPKATHHYVERTEGCGEYILVWCFDGEGWVYIDGVKRTVKKSQFFILPPDKGHAYGASDNQPWSIYWVHFSGDVAHKVCASFCGLHSYPHEGNIHEVCELFDQMLTILESHADEDTAAFIDLSFPRLLSAFIYPDMWNCSTPVKGDGNLSIVGKASHYMEEHVGEKLTLADICSYLGYSESYVTRVFSQEVGCGPITYLLKLKAARACLLLENTSLKINQIAMMLGFDDPYYFSKFFTKTIGLSPRTFRRRTQGKDLSTACLDGESE